MPSIRLSEMTNKACGRWFCGTPDGKNAASASPVLARRSIVAVRTSDVPAIKSAKVCSERSIMPAWVAARSAMKLIIREGGTAQWLPDLGSGTSAIEGRAAAMADKAESSGVSSGSVNGGRRFVDDNGNPGNLLSSLGGVRTTVMKVEQLRTQSRVTGLRTPIRVKIVSYSRRRSSA